MNPLNHGVVVGRLVRDAHLTENKDKSRTALFTVAVKNDFKSKDGEQKAQFVNLEQFIPAGQEFKVYDYMKKGTLVSVTFSVRSDQYEKDGETIYTQKLHVDRIGLLARKAGENAMQEEAEEEIENPFV